MKNKILFVSLFCAPLLLGCDFGGQSSSVAPSSEPSSQVSESSSQAGESSESSKAAEKVTVTFKNGEETLKTEEIEKGTAPSYTDADPTKDDNLIIYAFTGWTFGGQLYASANLPVVNENAIFVATYEIAHDAVKVTWDVEGEKTEANYKWGSAVVIPDAPSKAEDNTYTYAFNGWGVSAEGTKLDEIPVATENVTYYALFTPTYKEYKVTFDVEGEKTELNFHYGETPAFSGTEPVKTKTAQYSYEFEGWALEGTEEVLEELPAVSGAVTYKAIFSSEVNKYSIKFVDDAGDVLQSKLVEYGQPIVYNDEDPTKAKTASTCYSFAGWALAGSSEIISDLGTVTGAATYHPIWNETPAKYTVKFLDEDGTQLSSKEYEYNQTPAFEGATPTKEQDQFNTYSFSKWTVAGQEVETLPNVSEDVSYTAKYASTPRKYEVKFNKKFVSGAADGTPVTVQANASFDKAEIFNAPEETGFVANKPNIGLLVQGAKEVDVYYSTLADYVATASDSLEGTGTEADPYLVKSSADLLYIKAQLALETPNTFEGKFIKMANSIDAGNTDVAFGVQATIAFNGTFDGNNCIIKNYKGVASLFGSIGSKAVIKNLSVSGSVTGNIGNSAIFATASQAGSKIENCYNYANLKSIKNNNGSFVGYCGGDVIGCENYGEVDNNVVGNTANHTGGIIGCTNSGYKTAFTVNVKNCNNFGHVDGNSETGGIVAGNDAATCTLNIENCNNYAQVDGTYSTTNQLVGGIFGGSNASGAKINMKDCNNYGKVTSYSDAGYEAQIMSKIGGIAGGNLTSTVGMSVLNCNNYADIVGGRDMGGIVGFLASAGGAGANQLVDNCKNFGNISGNATLTKNHVYFGGIVGGIYAAASTTSTITISNCVNNGSIKGWSGVGGIIGATYGGAVTKFTFNVTDCTNNGYVEGYTNLGGITGYELNYAITATYTNCINNGHIHNATDASQATIGYSAGILGWVRSTAVDKFVNCVNNGEITSAKLGGIAGIIAYTGGSTNLTLDGCVNNGNVTTKGNHVAGVLASTTAAEGTTLVMKNCSNTGAITGGSIVGGVIAHIDCVSFKSCELKTLTNTGIITGSSKGEIIGVNDSTVEVQP